MNWIYFVLAETIGFTALNPSFLRAGHVLSLIYTSIFHSVSNLQRGNFVIREESTNEDRDEYNFEPPPIELYTQFSLLTYFSYCLYHAFLVRKWKNENRTSVFTDGPSATKGNKFVF